MKLKKTNQLRQEKKTNNPFSSNSPSAVNNADDSSDSLSGFVSVFYGSDRSGGFVLMVPVVLLVPFRWFIVPAFQVFVHVHSRCFQHKHSSVLQSGVRYTP